MCINLNSEDILSFEVEEEGGSEISNALTNNILERRTFGNRKEFKLNDIQRNILLKALADDINRLNKARTQETIVLVHEIVHIVLRDEKKMEFWVVNGERLSSFYEYLHELMGVREEKEGKKGKQ